MSQGITYFRWHGPARGPVVVAIHGLSTPSIVLDDIAAGLGRMGYRVLTYDLYGRGLSGTVSGRQDAAFFLRQLEDLIADQKLGDDLTLVGYSMGGAIATEYAARNPDRMRRLILLATAGIKTNESRFSKFCRQVPILGDWVHGVFAGTRTAKSLLGAGDSDVVRAQKAELSRQGFLPAILSSRRGMLSVVQEKAHRDLAITNIPVAAIWGGADPVVPVSALGQLAQ